jgi:hypothetical protein
VTGVGYEPCAVASDLTTCTTCLNFSDGVDAGLVTLSATQSNNGQAESFCVYNAKQG